MICLLMEDINDVCISVKLLAMERNVRDEPECFCSQIAMVYGKAEAL